ncbi:integrator complex subunit 2, putative [Acanthamoeba castellanii str. Neff]|uniref:Integrator complex subunit 2, putative n=1 Tax=Acanthamoeba castellanii (strain ATCC 30010 / Neff) TaxID=1257118 RepID=L8GVY6_ACACF|nr:integrator complex subunit 2, putative [Acanthamoeba castellanii str. Neff]ELR16773.1 integrator complex subunit 2, putative [Acanthamoeba castellanii str. Neff]
MEMEGDEGMMETEEEWGTAPVASSSGPAGNGEKKSEEWGAFESILDEKSSANAQQQQQMVEEVVTCLPYLVRVALANPAHSILFQKLHALPQLNSVLAYLALDIDAVEDPLEAELQRKRKTGSTNPAEGSLVFQYGEGLVSEFETGSEEVKMRLFLSELHNVMDHVRLANASKSRGATRSFPAYHSEIFGDELYLEELGFILPIAMLRLRRAPLSLEAVIEALLCVDLGGRLLRILFFNMPALRDEILLTLIKCAAAAPHLVTEVLLDLCSLSATIALFVRTWVMQQHQLPGLALKLTITHIKDEV